MGNPLSPLVAELFMASFEVKLRNGGLLPRVWHRYVDDVCAVVHKDDVQKTLDILNSQHESIIIINSIFTVWKRSVCR